MKTIASFLLTVLVSIQASPVFAQEIVESYIAYIGRDDLYNSSGTRLSQPWQILRQDRANYHKFGISQQGDEWDSFFGSVENRAIMERMVMSGSIESAAARRIIQGGSTVLVRVYGRGGIGDSVVVTVLD